MDKHRLSDAALQRRREQLECFEKVAALMSTYDAVTEYHRMVVDKWVDDCKKALANHEAEGGE